MNFFSLKLLKQNKTRDQFAEANVYTQRHMNNALYEMVTLTPCLALYDILPHRLIQCIWDMLTPTFLQTL